MLKRPKRLASVIKNKKYCVLITKYIYYNMTIVSNRRKNFQPFVGCVKIHVHPESKTRNEAGEARKMACLLVLVYRVIQEDRNNRLFY